MIYVKRPGLPDPILGDFLGDFTNEMNGDDTIVEFVLAHVPVCQTKVAVIKPCVEVGKFLS